MKRTHNPVKKEHIHYIQGDERIVEMYAYPLFDKNKNVTQALLYCLDITKQKKAEKSLKELQLIMKRKDGSFATVELNASPTYKNGKITGILGAARDITEQKKAGKELQKSQERLRSLFEAMAEGIVFIDRNGQIVQANPAAERMLGLIRSGDYYSTPAWELIRPDGTPMSLEEMAAPVAMKKKRLVKGVVMGIRAEGMMWVSASAAPIFDETGSLQGVVSIVTDITEQKKMEEEFRERDKKVRELADYLPQPLFETDGKGTFTYVNQSMLESFKYTQNDVKKGLNILHLFVLQDRKRISQNMQKIMNGQTVKEQEYTALRKDKLTFSALMYSSPIIHQGITTGIRGIILDITERKKAENQMKKQLMKFDLKEGNVYLVKECTPRTSLEIVADLLNVGYPGLIISRTRREKFNFTYRIDYVWVAEKGGKTILPDVKKIEQKIEMLANPTVILIDRVDYLIFKNTFEKVLSFVQHVAEIAYMKGHTIIVSVDPSVLREREINQLEKETIKIQPVPQLSEDLFDVLQFVYQQNFIGVKPSYKRIGLKIKKSKPTVRKRIRTLINYGCLKELKKGRTKVVEVTEKGKTFFR